MNIRNSCYSEYRNNRSTAASLLKPHNKYTCIGESCIKLYLLNTQNDHRVHSNHNNNNNNNNNNDNKYSLRRL